MQADTSSIVPLLKAAAALQLSKQISAEHRNSKMASCYLLKEFIIVEHNTIEECIPEFRLKKFLLAQTIFFYFENNHPKLSFPQRSNTAAGRQYFATSQASLTHDNSIFLHLMKLWLIPLHIHVWWYLWFVHFIQNIFVKAKILKTLRINWIKIGSACVEVLVNNYGKLTLVC